MKSKKIPSQTLWGSWLSNNLTVLDEHSLHTKRPHLLQWSLNIK